MIRKIAKFFAGLIGVLVGFTVLFYLVLLLINWHDVPPSEVASQFTRLYKSRPTVADDHNAFVFMTGMPVEATKEPMQAGLAMIANARNPGANGAVTGYSHPQYPQIDFKRERAKEMQDVLESCRSIDGKCLVLLSSKSVSTIQPGALDALLLQRYRRLIEFQEWQDIYPQTPEGPFFPQFTPALEGQQLSLFDIWHHALASDANLTVAMLDKDASFWRRVLDSSDSLLTSMVATAALRRNILWTNLVMRRLSVPRGIIEQPATWRVPISDEERVMKRAWVGEWVMTKPMARQLPEQARRGDSGTIEQIVTSMLLPLYQPQDSINLYARDLASSMDEHNVPYEKLAETVKSSLNIEDTNSLPHTLYNPLGRYLHNIARPDTGKYFLRMADLEGGRRALLAILQLRAEKMPREKITASLAVSPYRNPYSNEPFAWDEVSGSVVFEGLGEGARRRYLFPY